jgi:hypothetical protein
LQLFVLNRIERCARAWLETGTRAQDLQQQLLPFFERLQAAGALAGRSAEQSYFLKVAEGSETIRLNLGFAFDRPGEYLRYELVVVGPAGVELRPVAAFDAALVG